MQFEIEDAGGGCVLGPEVVIVRAADGRSHVGHIPAPAARERDAHAVAIVAEGLSRLGAGVDDDILLCQGNLFDRAAQALTERGFQVSRGQVSQDAHALAEGEHLRVLRGVLGYTPSMRDRGYAGLNFRLMDEVRRRPQLWRSWKASVRIPLHLQAAHNAFWGGRPPAETRRSAPRGRSGAARARAPGGTQQPAQGTRAPRQAAPDSAQQG